MEFVKVIRQQGSSSMQHPRGAVIRVTWPTVDIVVVFKGHGLTEIIALSIACGLTKV